MIRVLTLGLCLPALLCLSTLYAAEIKAPRLDQLQASANEYVTGPVLDQAIALAKFLNPETKIQQQVLNTLEATLPKMLQSDPQFVALESAYPGLTNVIVESLKPKMLAAYAQKTPLLWERLGAVYANNLTASELDSLLAFYQSPAGQRLLVGFSQSGNNTNIIRQGHKTGADMDKLAEAAQNDISSTARKVSATMTDADRIAIFKFENSPLGVKLVEIIPKILKASLEWDMYFTDAQRKDFASTRGAAVTGFIAESDAKAAAKSGENAVKNSTSSGTPNS
jgi:hypothetical protein